MKIDGKLSIKAQALAILALLEDQELDFDNLVRINSYAWYDGRERGVSLVMDRFSNQNRKCLVITFGEHRSSDSIFVISWEMDEAPFNGPVDIDCPVEAYDNKKMFSYGECNKAVDFILRKLNQFNDQLRKAEVRAMMAAQRD